MIYRKKNSLLIQMIIKLSFFIIFVAELVAECAETTFFPRDDSDVSFGMSSHEEGQEDIKTLSSNSVVLEEQHLLGTIKEGTEESKTYFKDEEVMGEQDNNIFPRESVFHDGITEALEIIEALKANDNDLRIALQYYNQHSLYAYRNISQASYFKACEILRELVKSEHACNLLSIILEEGCGKHLAKFVKPIYGNQFDSNAHMILDAQMAGCSLEELEKLLDETRKEDWIEVIYKRMGYSHLEDRYFNCHEAKHLREKLKQKHKGLVDLLADLLNEGNERTALRLYLTLLRNQNRSVIGVLQTLGKESLLSCWLKLRYPLRTLENKKRFMDTVFFSGLSFSTIEKCVQGFDMNNFMQELSNKSQTKQDLFPKIQEFLIAKKLRDDQRRRSNAATVEAAKARKRKNHSADLSAKIQDSYPISILRRVMSQTSVSESMPETPRVSEPALIKSDSETRFKKKQSVETPKSNSGSMKRLWSLRLSTAENKKAPAAKEVEIEMKSYNLNSPDIEEEDEQDDNSNRENSNSSKEIVPSTVSLDSSVSSFIDDSQRSACSQSGHSATLPTSSTLNTPQLPLPNKPRPKISEYVKWMSPQALKHYQNKNSLVMID